MTPTLAFALAFVAGFIVIGGAWHVVRWLQRRAQPVHDDVIDDPDVQAMLREVIRTGRPMTMNRGEAPRFVDGVDRTPRATDTRKGK